VALSCGFGAFQILIHIKREGDKPGAETTIHVAEGSNVAIHGNEVDVTLPRQPTAEKDAAIVNGERPVNQPSVDLLKKLKTYSVSDKPITKDGVTVDENAWRIEATKNRTVRLFEIADPGVEDCTILYRAKMKCESLDGKAYLEMWCRSSTGGEAFSKGLDNTVTGATDWASYEIPFFLKRGEACDLIKLNAVIEGKGTLWIKDVELLKGPLPSGIQTSAASQPEVEIESDSASNHGDVAAQSQTDKEQWARELAGLQEGNWRGAFQVGQQLAKLPPEDGFAILKENWEEIGAVDARQQMLKAWSFSQNHPRILDVLDLGMNDPSPEVQGWAQNYLRSLAFKDFAEDFPAYKAWYAAAQGKPLADVVAESVREFVADAAKADGKSPLKRVELMNTYCGRIFQDMPEVRAAAIDAGLVQVLERWIAIGVEPKTSRENVKLAAQAMRAIAPLKLDEEELRRVVMPRLTRQTPGEVRAAAAEALKRKEFPWAADLLVDVLKDGLYTEDLSSRAVIWAAATALAEIGDPKTIPPMIAVIEADNTYDTVYGVGYFGLGRLTGVTYDESHNGAWWRQWWEKNRERYPTDIREIPIPNLPKRATPPSNRVKTDDPQADVADIAAVDLQAGGDPKKRYFLNMKSGDQAPPQGFGLLIVLPGGDGSEDFQPFVRRIHKNVLGKGWLIAQAVAPKWDGKQSDQVVWPTDGLKYPAAKFTTEEFVEAIVADVQTKLERQKVDPKRIFVLGWSSGGAAAYAAALRKGSPLTGAFVAMSVFKPEQLPAIENAKGKSFYLLQSPDDALIPMRFADTAAKTLQEAGANVHLQHYAGGHGWHGDVWKLIGDGISWLDQRATIATDGKPE
jgi:predicted esterase